jgi:hypothetical protein
MARHKGRTAKGRPDNRCDCSDTGCPACHGKCRSPGEVTIYPVDSDDPTGRWVCWRCAEAGQSAGVFSVERPT